MGPLVASGWLHDRLDDPRAARGGLPLQARRAGRRRELWREGHIPGAAFMDVDSELASAPGERGRHPLPDAESFQAAARRAGIGPDSLVVAYDEAGEGGAARLWWLLRHFGHEQVAVLDGGLRGWRAEGSPLEAGPEQSPRRASSSRGPARATCAEAEELAGRLLLDARAPERYRGEIEPIDPVAGHIPGAANLPFAELAPDGRFLPPEDLRPASRRRARRPVASWWPTAARA